ncbi:hypothetical protein GCM10027056_30310 [Glaciibacter psychrotolerans]
MARVPFEFVHRFEAGVTAALSERGEGFRNGRDIAGVGVRQMVWKARYDYVRNRRFFS